MLFIIVYDTFQVNIVTSLFGLCGVHLCVCVCVCEYVSVYECHRARVHFMAIGCVINILVNTCTLRAPCFIKGYIGWVIGSRLSLPYSEFQCLCVCAERMSRSSLSIRSHSVHFGLHCIVRCCSFVRLFASIATPPNHKYLTRLKYMGMYHPLGKIYSIWTHDACVCVFPESATEFIAMVA